MQLITPLSGDRPPILVVSHERSGTHFTMNSLARCFGYVSNPWIDFDWPQFNINYFWPPEIAQSFSWLAGQRPANLVKSHHEVEFFAPVLEPICREFHLVYVHRRPADALASYWRFLNTLPWMEGPKRPTALEFATAAPIGRLMRYQCRQHGTMLDRWASHVSGWVAAAQRIENLHVIGYEDLDGDYEGTIAALARGLGQTPGAVVRPTAGDVVVAAGPNAFEPAEGADDRAAINELARANYPELMANLGYSADGERTRV